MGQNTQDQKRRRNAATSAAMKRMSRKCKGCGRGQNPRRTFVLDVGFLWTCRYCGHEHGGTLGRPLPEQTTGEGE